MCIISATTKLFSTSPSFDFADFGAIVGGISNGASTNKGNAEVYEERPAEGNGSSHLSNWNGDPAAAVLSRSTVLFDVQLGSSRPPAASIRRAINGVD